MGAYRGKCYNGSLWRESAYNASQWREVTIIEVNRGKARQCKSMEGKHYNASQSVRGDRSVVSTYNVSQWREVATIEVNRGKSPQWKPIEVRTVGGSYGRGDGRSGDGRPSVRRSVARSVSRTDRGHTHRSLKTCSVRRPATSEAVAVRRSLLYCPRAHAACGALLLLMLLQRPLLPPQLQLPPQL